MYPQCTECSTALKQRQHFTPYCSADCALRALANGRASVYIERFKAKFPNIPTSECWPWPDGIASNGYGVFAVYARQVGAHRAAYVLTYGLPPEGHVVRHSCDYRACFNPAHLVHGTQADNIADRDSRGHTVRGARQRLAKLTDADVLSFRQRYDSGETYQSLAATFQIDKKHAWRIAKRKVWTHI